VRLYPLAALSITTLALVSLRREGVVSMPTLTLEPRDAGVLDPDDLMVDFEDDLSDLLNSPQACTFTCRRTVCTLNPCCVSIV
jgi:hypothetical protein